MRGLRERTLLIHTAELNGVDAFEYLVALLRHPVQIAANPGEWMPWNFRTALERSGAGPGPAHGGARPGAVSQPGRAPGGLMCRCRHIGAACASEGLPPQISAWNSWVNSNRLTARALSTAVGQ